MDNKNYCIIMGGGVGRRFWPISRNTLPKQFMDFFGTGRTLIQQTFDRYRKIIPLENIFVTTNQIYKNLVHEQLPELDESQIILEPATRNTAPSIALASYHIAKRDRDANIVVAPTDHLIIKETEFLEAINRGLDFVSTYPYLLTLGIRPNRPVTDYGYIQVTDETIDGFFKVKTFIEKPELEFAKMFVESGEFYWNSGIFLWNVQSILESFRELTPDICAKLGGREEGGFSSCPNISIDYAIMEKANNVYVQLCDFGWADLGTWDSLYEQSVKDEEENAVMNGEALMYDSRNNMVALPKDSVAIIQGLDGYLVAVNKGVLLICKKENTSQLRKYFNDLQMKHGDEFI